MFELWSRKGVHFGKAFLLTIISVFILGLALLSYHTITMDHVRQQFGNRIIYTGRYVASQINGDLHQYMVTASSAEKNNLYKQLALPLITLKRQFPEIIQAYTLIETEETSLWQIVLKADQEERDDFSGVQYDAFLFPQNKLDSEFGFILPEDSDNWLDMPVIVYSPIMNNDNEVVALLGLVFATDELSVLESKLLQNGLVFMGVLIIAGLAISSIITRRLLRPIDLITRELEKIRDGNKEIRLSENLGSEWSFLAANFNNLLEDNYKLQRKQKKAINMAVKEKGKIFQVYRDVMYAVTRGKVFLVTVEEFHKKIREDLPLFRYKLTNKKDITLCRREVDVYLTQYCELWAGVKRKQVLLCLSEAITNAIKHAGSGEVLIAIDGKELTLYVIDQGPGMDLEKLPYMVFINGFTTKISLGAGFSLMHHYMDKMIIGISKQGTYLALEINLAGNSTCGSNALLAGEIN